MAKAKPKDTSEGSPTSEPAVIDQPNYRDSDNNRHRPVVSDGSATSDEREIGPMNEGDYTQVAAPAQNMSAAPAQSMGPDGNAHHDPDAPSLGDEVRAFARIRAQAADAEDEARQAPIHAMRRRLAPMVERAQRTIASYQSFSRAHQAELVSAQSELRGLTQAERGREAVHGLVGLISGLLEHLDSVPRALSKRIADLAERRAESYHEALEQIESRYRTEWLSQGHVPQLERDLARIREGLVALRVRLVRGGVSPERATALPFDRETSRPAFARTTLEHDGGGPDWPPTAA